MTISYSATSQMTIETTDTISAETLIKNAILHSLSRKNIAVTQVDSPDMTVPIMAVGTAIMPTPDTRVATDTVIIPTVAITAPSAATIRQIIGMILFITDIIPRRAKNVEQTVGISEFR